jgi:biotin carboxyl carrier protein
MKYKITIEDQEFLLTEEEASTLNSVQIDDANFHIIRDHKNWNFQVLHHKGKYFKLKVNGNIHEIRIDDEKDYLVEKMGFSLGQTQKLTNIKAPMPGLILDIVVQPGQEINEGDPLLVLEAMKMENVLTADGHGVVEEIFIKQGEAVEKGQILIKME